MESTKFIWISGLVAGTAYLSTAYQTSYAFDRPIQSAITILLATAFAIIGASQITSLPTPFIHTSSTPRGQKYLPHSSRAPSPSPGATGHNASTYSLRRLRSIFCLLVATICLRSEISRRIVTQIQCAGTSIASFIPLALFLSDNIIPTVQTVLSQDRPVFAEDTLKFFISGRIKYLLPIALLSFSGFLSSNALSEPRSTYICANVYAFHTLIPLLQLAGTLLDCFIVIAAGQLLLRGHADGSSISKKTFASLGWASCVSATLLLFGGVIVYWRSPEHRYWVMTPPRWYVYDTIKLSFAVAFTIVCALEAICYIGVQHCSVITLVTSISFTALSTAWTHFHLFPPKSPLALILSLSLAIAATAMYLLVEVHSGTLNTPRSAKLLFHLPRQLSFVCLILFVLCSGFALSQHRSNLHTHPIESLTAHADRQHSDWSKQASTSRSVNDAAKAYRLRYRRDPPPHFSRWYSYAVLQESSIIDDFDSVSEQLSPFWSLSPAEIRLRTWETLSNAENGIGGVLIRNGRAAISPNVPGSHRWMLDGVIHIMSPFLKWLPDMDLAFNLNDECRVAVPFATIESMRKKGSESVDLARPKKNEFSPSRADDWKPIPEDSIKDTRFIESSFSHVFHGFGSVGCPPSSKARRERHWDVGSHCSTCAAPHSLDHFVQNWTLAANPCHQPDFADLHGLYLSPAAFKTTTELMPVFSQSRAHGFNDILYPSAWNYEDKASYNPTIELPDPGFQQKKSTLFWRGATSEGVSFGTGTWRGMTRQRLVHLFNNASSSSRYLALLPTTPISLGNSHDPTSPNADVKPEGQPRQTYAYRSLSPAVLHAHLSTSVNIVDHIERCRGRDCDDQLAEFAPQYTTGVDFQEHWKYKYLFDTDGAGFSGRFLPFLQSRSLPFKTGVMREWWEDRVTAWKHFVPVDLRLTEVWSLLAYFAGWPEEAGVTMDNGSNEAPKRWLMAPHDIEAEAIAMAGREWANKVLRKEDMEVYFFRLLLEWARLVDDDRDNLGWTIDLENE